MLFSTLMALSASFLAVHIESVDQGVASFGRFSMRILYEIPNSRFWNESTTLSLN